MREHLGIDVDALEEEDLMTREPVKPEYEQEAWDPTVEEHTESDPIHIHSGHDHGPGVGHMSNVLKGSVGQGKPTGCFYSEADHNSV